MSRTILFAAVVALAACGGSASSLASISPKAFSYWNVGPVADSLGTVELVADGCPTLDASQVQATLGGRPLKLFAAGGLDLMEDGKCEPPMFAETLPTPADEEETELVISDPSETVRMTFTELLRPPTPTLAQTQLTAGQSLHFRLDSKHLQDRISRVRFQPSGGAEQVWPIDFLQQNQDGSYDLPIPADAPAGEGTLAFDVMSDISVSCDGDVDCTHDHLPIENGISSTISSANLSTAPVQVSVAQ